MLFARSCRPAGLRASTFGTGLGLVAFCLLAACERDRQPVLDAGASIYSPWLSSEPPSLELDRLYRPIELLHLDLREVEEAGAWTRSEAPGVGPRATWWRDVDLKAEEVRAVEITVADAELHSLELLWREETSQQQVGRLRLAADEGVGSVESRVFRFELADSARWRGTIRRLGLRAQNKIPSSPSPRPAESVRFLGRALDSDRLESVDGTAAGVELSHEARNALVQVVGGSLERRLRAPEGGRLRLATGVLAQPGRPPLRLRVGLGESELWRGNVSAEQLRWTEVEIDLPPTPEVSTLRLEALDDGEGAALAFWGHPTLLSPEAPRRG
ncbi:MAG: hypothetical protein MI919_35245, partial [Holophagales bacterium]|nr:hypothetical protein [Holophagales bacterium]